jgi:hypothetical protein
MATDGGWSRLLCLRAARALELRRDPEGTRPCDPGDHPTLPPTGGEWRAWYAQLCTFIDRYHNRQDEAGRFARRLLREMNSLWIFLAQQGVEPTYNRAERPLRFGVLWRKRSHGTASDR